MAPTAFVDRHAFTVTFAASSALKGRPSSLRLSNLTKPYTLRSRLSNPTKPYILRSRPSNPAKTYTLRSRPSIPIKPYATAPVVASRASPRSLASLRRATSAGPRIRKLNADESRRAISIIKSSVSDSRYGS